VPPEQCALQLPHLHSASHLRPAWRRLACVRRAQAHDAPAAGHRTAAVGRGPYRQQAVWQATHAQVLVSVGALERCVQRNPLACCARTCFRNAAGTGLSLSSTASGTSLISSMPMKGKAACVTARGSARVSDAHHTTSAVAPAAAHLQQLQQHALRHERDALS
jgi:hypothetical protein